jgi:transcription elongation GreA/GreB family factor
MHQTARTDLRIDQLSSPLLRAQSLVHLGSGEKERVSVGSEVRSRNRHSEARPHTITMQRALEGRERGG